MGDIKPTAELNVFRDKMIDIQDSVAGLYNNFSTWFSNARILSGNNVCIGNCGSGTVAVTGAVVNENDRSADTEDRLSTGTGTSARVSHTDGVADEVVLRNVITMQYPVEPPRVTNQQSSGSSVGGARSVTSTSYEEHTITNGEAFSNAESWGTATAVDSAHAADLWFSYRVSNTGTEYAREIGGLAFNLYIGDDPNPVQTYFVAPELGGDGKFHNFMPGESHPYTSRRLALSLDQMRALDLGAAVRVELEDYNYGIDELFYADAMASGVLIAIEDGTDDGDEAIEPFLIPTWGDGDTAQDVIARYFPHDVDADGMMTAIWTPEYRADTPGWCDAAERQGDTLWCKHTLSTSDWWNIYTNNLGDGTTDLNETPAVGGATALFRFNKDTDLDGYSDRSEARLGSDPEDAASYPRPELLAGVHSITSGSHVTATLSLLNTGLYDAYGVEAIMIAPDDSTTITNNTVGGSGRVKAQKDVVVGSRILAPVKGAWTGTAQPNAGGYYTGTVDRTYTFTVQCASPGGCNVGEGDWSLAWSDGLGDTGTLALGAGYLSPTPLAVGSQGLQVALLSGTAYNGNSFTVEARTPRDTFQYTINREPHTEPVVIVSYNDPQGNHRFITPVVLGTPTDDLAPYAGQMLPDPGVEIVTRDVFDGQPEQTLDLVVNNPSGVTLEDAHLFLDFVDIEGVVAAEFPITVDLQAGPTVVGAAWSTGVFSPTFTLDSDYIVMAFLTDYEGNILDTAGRPLSSWQEDPQPELAMAAGEAVWDLGEVAQGTLAQRTFTLANVGSRGLLTYVEAPAGLSVSEVGSREVGVTDQTAYEVVLNTDGWRSGRTRRRSRYGAATRGTATRTVVVQGAIVSGTPDEAGPAGAAAGLCSDGAGRTCRDVVQLPHDLLPEPQTLHPVRVYSEDYGTLWGYGCFLRWTFPGEVPGPCCLQMASMAVCQWLRASTRFEFSHDQCDRIRHQRDRQQFYRFCSRRLGAAASDTGHVERGQVGVQLHLRYLRH